MQTAVHLRVDAGDPAFVSVWEDLLPAAVLAGRTLHRDGMVTALVERSAPASALWSAVAAAVSAAQRTAEWAEA